MSLIDKIKETGKTIRNTAIIGAAALSLYACPPCPVPTPNPEPTPDTVKPIVSINRENPYEVYVGDDVPYMLGVLANDETDGNITDRVSYSPEIGEDEGVYSVEYKAKDNAGNEGTNTGDFKRITEDGLAKLFDDFQTLIPNGEGGFYTPREAIDNMTFDKVDMEGNNLGKSSFELPRGTNDNVADNIVGNYLVTGRGIDNLGTPYAYSGFNVSFSGQSGYVVDKVWAGELLKDSVLTGSADGKVGIAHLNYYGDTEPWSVTISNIDLIDRDLAADSLELFLRNDGTGREWIRFTEDYIKQ